MKRVTVIGGGITGLSFLHELQKLNRQQDLGLELTLVEKEAALGGKIRTVKKDGFIMEVGADSIVARNEGVLPFIEELGLEERLVYNSTGISYLYTDGQLHAIPEDTVFGIPMSEEALFSSTLVSEKGKQEALKDFNSSNETFTKDSSVGEFLEAFLGRELVEKQVAPVLTGVYSGNLYELTLASTLPYLLDYKNDYGSIIKGLQANKAKFKGTAEKKFISFDDGMAVLIDRLESELSDVSILKNTKPEKLMAEGERYRLTFADQKDLLTDYLIFAAPHDAAQQLLLGEELDAEFSKLKNSSLISVYLGFDIPDERLPADGTGFIVAENSDLLCNACTWTSRKWAHTSKNGNLLVRLFYKSSNPAYEKLKDMAKEELLQVALHDIEKSLAIQAEPKVMEVTDWTNLMPNYRIGHKAAVDSLARQLAEKFPKVKLAGASYYGVGIGACIQNGRDTARRLAEELTGGQ